MAVAKIFSKVKFRVLIKFSLQAGQAQTRDAAGTNAVPSHTYCYWRCHVLPAARTLQNIQEFPINNLGGDLLCCVVGVICIT
jgi:hypothetical protein